MQKKETGVLKTLAVAISLVSSVAEASAATDYFNLSPEQLLNAMVVSASKTKETVGESPSAVYVITQEDIARSGMTSIPELLRLAPGVEVARQNSNTWAISIRGFNSARENKILVMVDGRSVYNPLFAGTFWEVQDMPLQDIERIEVIRGPGGALWGANAVNGIINIITKNAKVTTGNLVTASAGNYEKGLATVRHGGPIDDSGRDFYRVYAKYTDRGEFHSLQQDPHDAWQNYRSGFRMDWGDGDTKDHVSIHGDIYHVDSDVWNTTYSLTAPFSSTQPETINSDGLNLMESWNRRFDDGSAMKFQAFVDYTSRDQILFQDHRTMFDVDTQYNLKKIGMHSAVLGGDFRVTSDDIGGSTEITFDPARRTDVLYSIFAQDKMELQPDHWFLTVGSKFEHNNYTGLEVQPDARLEWLPDNKQTIWTAVSRAVRTPSRIERDLNIANVVVGPGVLFPGFPTEEVLEENKNFTSEDLIAYEAGYRKQITPAVSADLTAFANDYSNLFSEIVETPFFVPAGADPAHFVLPIVAVNQMSAEVYGTELASSWKVNPDWKLSGGYTFLKMYLHSPKIFGFSQERGEFGSPQRQLHLRSFWNINDDWTFDTMAFYVSRLPQMSIPSYVRIDANLGWRINKGLNFNLVGQNLLSGMHREFGAPSDLNATQVPRSVFGKLTWQF